MLRTTNYVISMRYSKVRGNFKSTESQAQSRNMIVVVNVLYLSAGQRSRNVHIPSGISRGGKLRGRGRWWRWRRMAGRASDPSGGSSLRDNGADRGRVFCSVFREQVVGSRGRLPNVRIHLCRALRDWWVRSTDSE